MHLDSFDVFDTVLVRVFAEPRDLFVVLGEELKRRALIVVDANSFAASRAAAEGAARRQDGNAEVVFEQIYQHLAPSMRWDAGQTKQALACELEIEERSILPLPGAIRLVEAARAAGNQVLFLSDMYLPSAFLQKLLRRHGFWREGDRLFVSSEVGCTKSTGALYEKVRSELGVVSEWTHYGDNEHADIAVPRRLGIRAVPRTEGRLSRQEKLTRGGDTIAPPWRSMLAGAMRLTRLDAPAPEADQAVIWETGAAVVGPLFFGFVHWCLEEARARGLKRLYFISRDGQILLRIAQVILRRWGGDIECRYLYGSRQAWRPPAIEHLSEADWPWVFPPTHQLSLRQTLARLALDSSGIQGPIEQAGFASATVDEPLSEEQKQRLAAVLLTPGVRRVVDEHLAQRRELVLKYFEQEGLLEKIPTGFVDIGWAGTVQRNTSRILSLGGHDAAARLAGLYFGLWPGTRESASNFMLDYWHRPVGRLPRLERLHITLLEAFSAGEHGSVTGYESTDGRVRPVLTEPDNASVLNWGLPLLHSSIVRFAEEFAAHCPRHELPSLDFQAVTTHGLLRFMFHPTASEAAVWGRFPLTDRLIDTVRGEMVTRWNTKELLAALADYRKRPSSWWAEGSLAVRPHPALRAFLLLRRLKWRLADCGIVR